MLGKGCRTISEPGKTNEDQIDICYMKFVLICLVYKVLMLKTINLGQFFTQCVVSI